MRSILINLMIGLIMSSFIACDDSQNVSFTGETSYRVNISENRDIPIDSLIASIGDEEAQFQVTRGLEPDTLNVYVLSGSVRITEATIEQE